ncbi:hypothetical protein GWI33_015824, partial [Rhynchophorus ferrugineus]
MWVAGGGDGGKPGKGLGEEEALEWG